MFTVPKKYIPKYEVAIAKWNVAVIIYPSTSHNPVNMFLKHKPNGEIRLFADLVPYNKVTFKNHGPIPNQALIWRTLGRVKYHSTIDLADWYLQIRVEPECQKYDTIKISFSSFACKVMLQGDTNVPATAIQVTKYVPQGFIRKFI
jgi:hypothetical protein